MALLRRLLSYVRPWKKQARRGYGEEVLYSGWVSVPRPSSKRGARR